jgi:hypothetical protein
MGRGKNYFIFLPQSWIDIFILWLPNKLEFLYLFCHIMKDQDKFYRLIPHFNLNISSQNKWKMVQKHEFKIVGKS